MGKKIFQIFGRKIYVSICFFFQIQIHTNNVFELLSVYNVSRKTFNSSARDGNALVNGGGNFKLA